jgi:alpha-glucosidase
MTVLRLTTDSDPWALSFGVLRQAGPARFSCAPRWQPGPVRENQADPEPAGPYQVTRVRQAERTADAFAAVLDTDHPDGLTAALQIRLGGDDTIAVTLRVEGAAVISQSFAATDGERFLGFGERSHAASLDHGVIENYVGEGPYQHEEYPFLVGTVPAWAMRERPDATYFPLPWVLSTAGYGLSIDQDDLSYVRLRTESADSWSIEAEADLLSYTIYAGPAPLDALRRYTAAAGRQPAPERWFFGPWYQTGHENHIPPAEEQRQLAALDGAPASAAETHCRYLPLGEDRGHAESERARTAFFHSRGLAALSYINPIVAWDYPEAFEPALAAGALQRHASGEPYLYQGYAGGRVPPHTDETQYDFTAPRAAALWTAVAERIVAAGYDGWMEDFGEYTPLDAVTSDGQTGPAPHNRYPTDFHTAAAAAAAEFEQRHGRRLARFVRSGWRGTPPAVPIVWGGDPTTGWGFDGLASAVTCGLSLGASGVAMWGSDTGGFMSTVQRLTPDLLRRWIQFSAFCPVMRTKAAGIEVQPYDRPQIWDDDILPTWRRWAGWHTRLNDYLMTAHEAYRETGRPIMCALELAYPGIGPVPGQYLLGPELLVAPVLEPDCTQRRVLLPPGRWLDLFDPGRSFTGPGEITMQVGPDDMPVLVRAGAVLALLPENVVSLSPYAPELSDRRSVLVFPGEPGQQRAGRLGPGLSGRSRMEEDACTLELSGPPAGSYEITAWLPAEPSEVAADGPWSYAGGVLTCSVRGPSPVIRARW